MDEQAHRRAMIEANTRQKDYYESRFEAGATGQGAKERAANYPTRAWTWLRRRIMRLRAASGVDEGLLDLHHAWLGDLADASVLDLGCFTGNRLSFWIAENAKEYVGVDLSEQAVEELNHSLAERQLSNATAVAMDFLANDWPDGRFDVVYAYSVLHHFSPIEVVLKEIHRLLKPGGIVITMDPLTTDPLNRVARVIYRPFQSDRQWEFPFSRQTLRRFDEVFEIEAVQGLQGVVKLAYPLLLIPGLEPVGKAVANRLREWDERHARSFGVPLYLCWHITMKLRRADTD